MIMDRATVVRVAVPVMMMMVMVRTIAGMVVVVTMVTMVMDVIVMAMIIGAFDRGFVVAAAAYRTHQSTSSSLTRNSSPPVTCS
jgi:hypothetical protein